MNRITNYSKNIVTAEEAVKKIKDNDFISLSHAAGIPQVMVEALTQAYQAFHNVSIYHMLCLGEAKYTAPEMSGHFRHITNFVGANTRKAVAEKRADFFPALFSEVPAMMRSRLIPIDVAIVQLSYPDDNGYCSFGISSDYSKPSTENAHIIIGELNRQMPYIGGDNLIHISQLDYIVEADYPLYTIPPPTMGPTEEAIGRYCASLIEDGSTLQLGIGAIPDAVLLFLTDKKDLGVHMEMFSDGVLELVKKGVINGKKKTLHPEKLIGTFLMGSSELYEFVNNNPAVEFYPVDYVNDPRIIAQNDQMISINSCLEVDLNSQVNSEVIGTTQFSGMGGQIDYIRGASWSKNGKSILAMPSTAKRGTVSRIVANLSEGTPVTTSRNEVDYVVTEYGIAKMKGKTLKERAMSLINIAHPDFRDILINEFNKRF